MGESRDLDRVIREKEISREVADLLNQHVCEFFIRSFDSL
jgi:hypothetical protein